MRIIQRYVLAGSFLAALVLNGCGALETNWKQLYSAKLGQPIEKLNTTVLNTPFTDEEGNLTRIG